jgi:hypothetical protein
MTTTQIVVGTLGLALIVLLGGSVLVSSVLACCRGVHSAQDVKRDAVRVRTGVVRSRERATLSSRLASNAGKVAEVSGVARSRVATSSRSVRRTVGPERKFPSSGSARPETRLLHAAAKGDGVVLRGRLLRQPGKPQGA